MAYTNEPHDDYYDPDSEPDADEWDDDLVHCTLCHAPCNVTCDTVVINGGRVRGDEFLPEQIKLCPECAAQAANAIEMFFAEDDKIADLRSQLATLTAERDKLREKVESLADAWCGKAVESHEEANRIRRTMRMITDAEERCTVRGDVLNRCAEELNWILSTPDAKGA